MARAWISGMMARIGGMDRRHGQDGYFVSIPARAGGIGRLLGQGAWP